jgi:hypothetical protein
MKANHFMTMMVPVLGSLCVLLAAGKTAKAQGTSQANTAGYSPVSYCELIRHPKDYDGKKVAVRATYRYGFEWQELFGVKCRDQGRTWLEFGADSASATRRALAKAPNHQGTLNATFYGTFQASKGPFGDGGYAFKFDVQSVKAVEVISKDGWAPERLSTSEQQRLCQGDEGISQSKRLGGGDSLNCAVYF